MSSIAPMPSATYTAGWGGALGWADGLRAWGRFEAGAVANAAGFVLTPRSEGVPDSSADRRALGRDALIAVVLGIIFLCQPWVAVLHIYSVTMMIVGLVAFLVAVHVPKPETPETEEGAHLG